MTGTNGKTSTTTWLAHALAEGPTDVVRLTTVGMYLGDERLSMPATYDGMLRAIDYGRGRGARYVAMELTSEALAKGYAKAWPCRIGVFTNITHDHLNVHGSFEHYLASKAQLFVALPAGGAAVLNAACESYPLLREVIGQDVRVLGYRVPSRGDRQLADEEPFLEAERVDVSWHGTRITYRCADRSFPGVLEVRGLGEIFAENALAALLGAFASGVHPEVASARLAAAPPPTGRFEVVRAAPHVVIDYAHTPDALERTVATARALAVGTTHLVFGAGGDRDQAKRPLLGQAARAADRIILTSDNPRGEPSTQIADDVRQGLMGHADVRVELDRRLAIELALADARPGDVVVIAGKGHETTQQVGREVRHFSDHEVVAAWPGDST